MRNELRKVSVTLGDRSYEILIGAGLSASLGARCKALDVGKKCVVVTDTHVGPRYADKAVASLKAAGFDTNVVMVPAGEAAKSLKVVARCYDAFAKQRLERKSLVVALGGGCVGDLAGFVAASYLRGLPFVQVPTTLLAQVDSSVGGKTGINIAAGKNLVGAFHQPLLVLCDLETLKTLTDREYRAGLAEIIKYGIIKDPALFKRLEKSLPKLVARDPAELLAVVTRSCEIKAEIVTGDETENAHRACLNFGHTIGHAIENTAGYGRYLHGEAISIGQVAAAHLSAKFAGLPETEVERIRQLFLQAGLPVTYKTRPETRTRLFTAMQHDKKVHGGEIKFVLARKLGEVELARTVADADIHGALDFISG